MHWLKLALLDTQSNDVAGRLNIENYKSCKIWLEGYNALSTKQAYKLHLALFCRHHNIDPDSLVQLKLE